jgi:Protein of unknown function (DUF2946)
MRQSGAVLALFALALQIVLSFGHMHPEDFFPPGSGGAGRDLAQTLTRGPSAPSPQSPAGDSDHDGCAICINMAMVGASALPPPVSIAPPVAVAHVMFAPVASAAAAGALYPNFRSRAPPLA